MGTIKGGYKWLGAKIGGNSVNGIAKGGNKIFEKNNNNIISSGLYYHISANDPLSYDGTNIIKDLSGNGRNGTIHSSPVKTGNILQFDGVDDYIDMGNILNVGTGEISYTIWVKSRMNELLGIIGNTVFASHPGRYGFYAYNGHIEYFLQGDTTVLNTVDINTNLAMCEITHVLKRDKQEFYLNGILISSINQTLGGGNYQPNIKFLISAYGNTSGTAPEAGLYNNMKFGESFGYQRALAETEVLQNYNALKNKYL